MSATRKLPMAWRRSALVPCLFTLSVVAAAGAAVAGLAHADMTDPRPGQWSGGAGTGFLTNTPDGVEFALKGHLDYFLRRALGGNDSVLGVSAQAKYWWDIAGTRHRATLVIQGGIGFVWADIVDTDSGVADTYRSFLIPVGIGIDYALTPRVVVTADFLLNFTSLGERVTTEERQVDLRTKVMPGLYLGVRF